MPALSLYSGPSVVRAAPGARAPARTLAPLSAFAARPRCALAAPRAAAFAAAAPSPPLRRPLLLATTPHRRPLPQPCRYREHRDVGRERAICDLGNSVASAIMSLLARPAGAPPAQSDVDTLRGNTARDLTSRIDGVLESESLQGQDALLAWVERERAGGGAAGGGSSMPSTGCTAWEILATAACPNDDAFFSLIETTHPSSSGPPLTLHRILWFDVEFDDTERLVVGVHHRAQVEPDDLSALVSVDSAHRALSATPFPHDRVKPYPPGLNVDVPLRNQARWCEARCSANDEKIKLYGGGEGDDSEPAIDTDRYRLWDAFGVLPVLCDPSKRAMPDACVVPGAAVADIIAAAKSRFTIDCRVQDAAISPDKTVGFTRWLSLCEVKETGEKFRLEGLEAVVFDEQGKLLDTWLFRDATPFERKRLLGE
jgi:hypothetical protein